MIHRNHLLHLKQNSNLRLQIPRPAWMGSQTHPGHAYWCQALIPGLREPLRVYVIIPAGSRDQVLLVKMTCPLLQRAGSPGFGQLNGPKTEDFVCVIVEVVHVDAFRHPTRAEVQEPFNGLSIHFLPCLGIVLDSLADKRVTNLFFLVLEITGGVQDRCDSTICI